jgi:hypothetical protein
VPVGTASSPMVNRLAQLAHSGENGGGTTLELRVRKPVKQTTVVGAKTAEGVSLSDIGNRGDLNSTSDVPAVISVTDSSDLNAVAQAVVLASFGENILVENSTFTRKPGGINVDGGTIFERTLTLRNSYLTADVIKARAFQNGGRDALLIDGSQFDASALVRLYAEGAGKLRFRGNVTINSPNTQLAGQTVEVDAGSKVTASGALKVNATNHNYDAAGFGVIESAGEKTRGSFEQRSRY